MARITVEDCLKQIPNRFELALAATYRRLVAEGAAASGGRGHRGSGGTPADRDGDRGEDP